MTPAQFAALARLANLGDDSPSREAVRLVMIDGQTGAEAARRTGITPAAVSNALGRLQKRLQLARVAVGIDGADAT